MAPATRNGIPSDIPDRDSPKKALKRTSATFHDSSDNNHTINDFSELLLLELLLLESPITTSAPITDHYIFFLITLSLEGKGQ